MMYMNLTPASSSRLVTPPSPSSPRSPLAPFAESRAQCGTRPESGSISIIPLPPPRPLKWLWQCHICHRTYPLAATRRCLDDGHYFCAGSTSVKRRNDGSKRLVRHKGCASEFDYQGWKTFSNWRRGVAEQIESAAALVNELNAGEHHPSAAPEESTAQLEKDPVVIGQKKHSAHQGCWDHCDYPSECRWRRDVVPKPVSQVAMSEPSPPKLDEITFDDILNSLSRDVKETASQEELTSSSTTKPQDSTGDTPDLCASDPPSQFPSEVVRSPDLIVLPAPLNNLDEIEIELRRSIAGAGKFLNDLMESLKTASAGGGKGERGGHFSVRNLRKDQDHEQE